MNSEAGIEAMASALIQAGVITQEQRAAADLAEQGGSAPPTSAAGKAPPPNAGAANAELRARAKAMVASGEISWAQHDEMLEKALLNEPPADGSEAAKTSAAERGPLAASGAPNPWEGVELEPGFGPPAKPEDYRFDLFHADPLTLEQLRGVGETFHAAKMPAPIASQIYSEIVHMAGQKIDNEQLHLLNANTMAQLGRLWGDQADAKIATAQAFVRELERVRPGVTSLLENSRAGSSPAVIRQIVEHAERLAAARRK